MNEKIKNDFKHAEVVVLEAALLIQANWTDHCHEIWSCIIPPYEVSIFAFSLHLVGGLLPTWHFQFLLCRLWNVCKSATTCRLKKLKSVSILNRRTWSTLPMRMSYFVLTGARRSRRNKSKERGWTWGNVCQKRVELSEISALLEYRRRVGGWGIENLWCFSDHLLIFISSNTGSH